MTRPQRVCVPPGATGSTGSRDEPYCTMPKRCKAPGPSPILGPSRERPGSPNGSGSRRDSQTLAHVAHAMGGGGVMFGLNALDGFDALAISFAAPGILAE